MSTQLIALLISLVSILGALAKLFLQVGRLSLQVETLWTFHLERAKVEAVLKGWGKLRSPVELTALAVELIKPYLDSHFLPLYAKLIAKNPRITDQRLFFEFERKFGPLLVEKICIPQGVSQGACLVAVLESCKVATKQAKQP